MKLYHVEACLFICQGLGRCFHTFRIRRSGSQLQGMGCQIGRNEQHKASKAPSNQTVTGYDSDFRCLHIASDLETHNAMPLISVRMQIYHATLFRKIILARNEGNPSTVICCTVITTLGHGHSIDFSGYDAIDDRVIHRTFSSHSRSENCACSHSDLHCRFLITLRVLPNVKSLQSVLTTSFG